LESSEIQEEWTEEEKIPIKKDATPPPKPAETPKQTEVPPAGDSQVPSQDAEMKNEEVKQPEPPKQEFEIRKKNKKATSSLKVDS
jgi:hypothetical protein